MALDGGEGGGLDAEAEARGEADGAQQPQMILAEADRRVADGTDQAALQVGPALHEIQHTAAFPGPSSGR